MTPRLSWRQAITSAPFPASQRPVKATLLALVELMTATGELNAWRQDLIVATGLPARTLDRHLQRAVEDGWLVHEVRGGHGRQAQYRAAIPGSCAPHAADNIAPPEHGCAPRMADNSASCAPPTRGQLRGVVRHPVAHSRKTGASDSEHGAVDRTRGRRTGHDAAGVTVDHTATLAGLPGIDKAFKDRLTSGERSALAIRDVDPATTRVPHQGHCPGCGSRNLVDDEACWSCNRPFDRAELLVVLDVSRTSAPPDDPEATTDQLLTEHTEAVGVLPNAIRVATRRQVLGLLTEGCQQADVRAGLARMRDKGLGLRMLPELVVEAQTRRTARKESPEPWELR